MFTCNKAFYILTLYTLKLKGSTLIDLKTKLTELRGILRYCASSFLW